MELVKMMLQLQEVRKEQGADLSKHNMLAIKPVRCLTARSNEELHQI
jgi:hypothetical protein